jgi:hypothetical protein
MFILLFRYHQAHSDLINRYLIQLDLKVFRIAIFQVCIDEAAFATDSGTLPILLRSRRLILSGDHFQLPPVKNLALIDFKPEGLGFVSIVSTKVLIEKVFITETSIESNQNRVSTIKKKSTVSKTTP